jgi:hypothetical protein
VDRGISPTRRTYKRNSMKTLPRKKYDLTTRFMHPPSSGDLRAKWFRSSSMRTSKLLTQLASATAAATTCPDLNQTDRNAPESRLHPALSRQMGRAHSTNFRQ